MNMEQQILHILIHADHPVASKDLAFQIGSSDKTVLKYLNMLKHELVGSGAEIEIRQRTGSILVVHDQKKFSSFCSRFYQKDLFNDPAIRSRYILMRLLLDSSHLDSYLLAEDIGISPGTLRSVIRSLTPVLQNYNLSLHRSHINGYRIAGTEEDIRHCLAREGDAMFIENALAEKPKQGDLQSSLHQIINAALKQFNIAVSYDSINALTLHALIAINRIETNNPVILQDYVDIARIKSKPEYNAAKQIASAIFHIINIQLNEAETLYLAMHIAGKQRLLGHDQFDNEISNDAILFYNKFLRKILHLTGEDFFNDEDLRSSLLNHIAPFLTRLRRNMLIEKTELTSIKSEFPLAYDTAVSGLTIIERTLPEAEISFFALHLQLALEKRKNTDHVRYNVAVYCEEVASIYQIVTFRLNQYFKEDINEIMFIPKDKRVSADLESCQLFLSLSDDMSSMDDSTIRITAAMSETDVAAIRRRILQLNAAFFDNIMVKPALFWDLEAADQYDVLSQMASRLANILPLPDDFLERVMEREACASTAYNNRIAIPHPIQNDDMPGFIAIARLQEPVLWGTKMVQLIFLISSNNAVNQWFYDHLAKTISDEKVVQKLLQAKDFSSFRKVFESI